jgi:hypothetical protein
MVHDRLGGSTSRLAKSRSHCEMENEPQANRRLLSNVRAWALLPRASFSAP